MIDDLVYALYAFLAFFEVLVLLASAIGVLTFVVWQVIKKIRSLTDAAMNSEPRSSQPSVQILNPVAASAARGAHVIPGGHNERF